MQKDVAVGGPTHIDIVYVFGVLFHKFLFSDGGG